MKTEIKEVLLSPCERYGNPYLKPVIDVSDDEFDDYYFVTNTGKDKAGIFILKKCYLEGGDFFNCDKRDFFFWDRMFSEVVDFSNKTGTAWNETREDALWLAMVKYKCKVFACKGRKSLIKWLYREYKKGLIETSITKFHRKRLPKPTPE